MSLIDSWLLSRKLIRKPLLKFLRRPVPEEKQNALQRQIVYSFGDHYYFRKELKIVNLLTGYVDLFQMSILPPFMIVSPPPFTYNSTWIICRYMFLLDKSGRIRWSGTGAATEAELPSLLSCTSILLQEN